MLISYKQLFCSTGLLKKGNINSKIFPMPHHEESPEKLQYNKEHAPPFCLTLKVASKKNFCHSCLAHFGC